MHMNNLLPVRESFLGDGAEDSHLSLIFPKRSNSGLPCLGTSVLYICHEVAQLTVHMGVGAWGGGGGWTTEGGRELDLY